MIREGDFVKDVTTGEIEIIEDIQYFHNRYQFRNKSNWRYGIENIVLLPNDEVLAEVRRLNDDLGSWKGIAHDRLLNWDAFAKYSKKLEQRVVGVEAENQRLQNENDLLKATSPLMTTTPLEIEIKHYKQALEEIVKRIMWGDSVHACIDCNLIAQKALEGDGDS